MARDTTRWGTVGALVLFGHLGAFASFYASLPEVPASVPGQTGVVTATVRLEVSGGVSNVSSQPKVETVKPFDPVTPRQAPEVMAPEVVAPVVEPKPQVTDTVAPPPVKPPPVKPVQSVKTVKPKESVKPKPVSKPEALSKTSPTATPEATPKATPSTARTSVTPSSTPSVVPSSVPSGNSNGVNAGTSVGAAANDYVGPSASADYLKNPHPKYPKMSLRRKEAGTVLLALTVTADGRAKDVRVLKTSGYPRLDQAALEAVKDWRFIPAKRLGRPVDVDYELPIHFKLRQ